MNPVLRELQRQLNDIAKQLDALQRQEPRPFPDEVAASVVYASGAGGLSLEDDGGNVGVFVEDGGQVGIRYNAPAYDLHIVQPTGTGKGILLAGKEYYQEANGSDTAGVWIGLGVSRSNNRQLWVGDSSYIGSSTNGFFRLFSSGTIARMGGIRGDGLAELPIVINENAQPVGFGGVGTPQGILHAHDGNAGFGLFTKTAVSNVSQTIIANGTGDVVRCVVGSIILYDGSAIVGTSALNLEQGGTTTFDIAGASSTWRTTLNADGSLTVARTSGASTATISYCLHWM